MLDQMGISAKSPIRQRVLGKDLNDPTARKILSSFAVKPRTSQAAELGISRTLEGVPTDQPDLFTPQRRQPAPQQDTGRLTGRNLAEDIADKCSSACCELSFSVKDHNPVMPHIIACL